MTLDLAVNSEKVHQKHKQQKKKQINWISSQLKLFVHQRALSRKWKGCRQNGEDICKSCIWKGSSVQNILQSDNKKTKNSIWKEQRTWIDNSLFSVERIATREAQECWSGVSIPSVAYLLEPGIKPGSPALQADSLPTELSGKPIFCIRMANEHTKRFSASWVVRKMCIKTTVRCHCTPSMTVNKNDFFGKKK